MARKVSSLEEQLDRLADLRGQPSSPEGRAEAAKCLASKMNLVAAKAARIAGEWQAAELTPELLTAFDRFMIKPETTDKRCALRISILAAQRLSVVSGFTMNRSNASTSWGASSAASHSPAMRAALAATRFDLPARYWATAASPSGEGGWPRSSAKRSSCSSRDETLRATRQF